MPIIKSFFKSSYVEKSKSKEIMKFLINLTKNLLKSGKNANDSQVVSTWIFVSVFHFELLLTRRCYLICIALISDFSCRLQCYCESRELINFWNCVWFYFNNKIQESTYLKVRSNRKDKSGGRKHRESH